MGNVSEAFSFGDSTVTGKAIGDLTISYCKDLAGNNISQSGMALTELGAGDYVLTLSTTVRTVIRGYLTADSTKRFAVMLDPVDGDIAKASTQTGFLGTDGKVKISTDAQDLRTTLKVYADLHEILSTAVTESSAGYLAASFKKLLDVAAPVLTAASVNQTGDSYGKVNDATIGLQALSDRLPDALDGGYMKSQVKGQDNIDFGALQKASLNAATPTVTVSDKTGFSLTLAYDAAKSAASQTSVDSISTAVGAIAIFLSGLVAAIWSYATRKLTSSLTDEGSPKDMAAVNDLSGLGTPLQSDDVRLDNLDAKISTRATPADANSAAQAVIDALPDAPDNAGIADAKAAAEANTELLENEIYGLEALHDDISGIVASLVPYVLSIDFQTSTVDEFTEALELDIQTAVTLTCPLTKNGDALTELTGLTAYFSLKKKITDSAAILEQSTTVTEVSGVVAAVFAFTDSNTDIPPGDYIGELSVWNNDVCVNRKRVNVRMNKVVKS